MPGLPVGADWRPGALGRQPQPYPGALGGQPGVPTRGWCTVARGAVRQWLTEVDRGPETGKASPWASSCMASQEVSFEKATISAVAAELPVKIAGVAQTDGIAGPSSQSQRTGCHD